VLPFTSMSNDSDQDYFADGITEDIITALSRISGLLVIARNSTMVYKDKAVDVKQVAAEQGVRYVLEGSVRRAGNRIRVTAQLIDATTGHHLWAERYDRDMDDVFAVQDEITQQITLEMRVQISIGEKARMMAGRTSNIEVWERLVRADELSNSLVKTDNLESRRLVEEAIQIDPKSVTAWTELGWSHWSDVYFGWSSSPEQSERLAREAADKARKLEPDYPNAYSLLGCITLLGEDFDSALEFLEQGVLLAPNNAENTAELALGLILAGTVDEAREMIRRAIRLSPICPAWYLMIVGLCALLSHDRETAISTLQNAVDKEPESVWSRAYLVSALVDSGQITEAQQLARTILSLERGFSVAQWHGARFKDPDIRAQTIENLRRAGLPE
jgi:adenylate cyclase